MKPVVVVRFALVFVLISLLTDGLSAVVTTAAPPLDPAGSWIFSPCGTEPIPIVF